MPNVEALLVKGDADLADISDLNQQHLRSHLDPAVALSQGFVTWRYDTDLLQQLHALAPSIIARSGSALAGYALTAPRAAASVHKELSLLLAQLDTLLYDGRLLSTYAYYVMGQLCVAPLYRGGGVVERMYALHHATYAAHYDLMVLTISSLNTRSIRVHERIGFLPIHHFDDHHGRWTVYVWDWRTNKGNM